MPGVPEQVRSLEEDEGRHALVRDAEHRLVRLTFATRPGPVRRGQATVTRFGVADGLPSGGVGAIAIHGRIYFGPWGSSTEHVIATWDAGQQRFVRDETISALPFDRLRGSFGVAEGPNGTLLANAGRGTRVLTPDGRGGWTVDEALFSRFGPVPTGFVTIEGDIAWFAYRGEVVRFDLKRAAVAPPPFAALIRRVTAGEDQVLYGGDIARNAPRLPSSSDALRVEFAAPTFIDETRTQYQTWLEGLEPDWTAWNAEARRDFTNLGFGNYRFHVRARSVTGAMAEEAVYAFTILPPWYRTWWAYLAYALALGFAVSGSGRLMRRRVVAKERERAQMAEARLRAESAEQLARSESEGKKTVELLSDIGRGSPPARLRDDLRQALRAGQPARRRRRARHRPLPSATPEIGTAGHRAGQALRALHPQHDRPRPASGLVPHPPRAGVHQRRPGRASPLRHAVRRAEPPARGSMSKAPQSIIYLPLLAKDRVLGVFTIQSFEAHAYTEHHLNMMRSLASYTAIALDNAAAYRQLNEQEHEIRRLFEEAEKARAAAEEADAAKSAFLSTVSHELRTPLTSVLGFAKIIKKRLDDRIFPLVPTDDRKVAQTVTQIEENLQVVVSEGERLTKLIDDVLDLAKIEAGKLEWLWRTSTSPTSSTAPPPPRRHCWSRRA